MTKEQYIKGILNNVHCTKKRKQKIKQEVEAEIEAAMESGKSLEEITNEMGNVLEVANGYNLRLPESEQKSYRKSKVSRLIIVIVVLLFFLSGINYWFQAKTYPLENSQIFDQEEIEKRIIETIDLIDAQDYQTLQEKSSVILMPLLTKEKIDEAKAKISPDFGARVAIGNIACMELIQGSDHYAVGEIEVKYENVSVVYRITIDPELKLAGFYVK